MTRSLVEVEAPKQEMSLREAEKSVRSSTR